MPSDCDISNLSVLTCEIETSSLLTPTCHDTRMRFMGADQRDF
jgi:hypothetical protein